MKATLFFVVIFSIWALAVGGEPLHYAGDGHIHFVNPKNGEVLQVTYRDATGHYKETEIAEIRQFLRCRLTGEIAPIPIELIELVDEVEDHFGTGEVEVLSGFRSKRLNESLRHLGRKVARHSLHVRGMAIDISLPGVPTRRIRDYAKSLKRGGVGYYPHRHFVHLDVGPVRYW